MASRSRQHLSGNLRMAGSGPENLFTRRDGSQKGGTRRDAPLLRGMKWRKSGFTRLSAGRESHERTPSLETPRNSARIRRKRDRLSVADGPIMAFYSRL